MVSADISAFCGNPDSSEPESPGPISLDRSIDPTEIVTQYRLVLLLINPAPEVSDT